MGWLSIMVVCYSILAISPFLANLFHIKRINDNYSTAPSKRISSLIPGYSRQKPLVGVLAALEIGLPKIRQECPLFDAWLAKLETLQPLPA